MTPRYPASWARAGIAMPAGSQPATWVPAARRVPIAHIGGYVNPVTVDLGNDGIAPSVLFQAGGGAKALIGPASGGDLWSLDQCFLSTSVGALDPAQCIVYAGPLPLQEYAITASLSGGSQQFGLGGVGVPFGWFIYAVWSGGTAGATATLRVTGRKTVLSN
jgi:hypothetical protein